MTRAGTGAEAGEGEKGGRGVGGGGGHVINIIIINLLILVIVFIVLFTVFVFSLFLNSWLAWRMMGSITVEEYWSDTMDSGTNTTQNKKLSVAYVRISLSAHVGK